LDQVFDLSDWFPLFFGGLSVVMGFSMYLNGRVVERIGLGPLLAKVFSFAVAAVLALLALALATDGKPGFWPFVVLLAVVLFTQQMLIPNLNAAAMKPLAQVAGTGAAILGMVPGVLGAVIGTTI